MEVGKVEQVPKHFSNTYQAFFSIRIIILFYIKNNNNFLSDLNII